MIGYPARRGGHEENHEQELMDNASKDQSLKP